MTGRIDYSALTDPIDERDLEAFTAQKSRLGWKTWSAGTRQISAALPFLGCAVLFLALVIASIALGNVQPLVVIVLAAAIALCAAVGFELLKKPIEGFGWPTMYRLSQFATANGLGYEPVPERRPSYPGVIFGGVGSSGVYNHLWSTSTSFFDLGNYREETGSVESTDDGVTTTTPIFRHYGFLAIRLDRKLPHMLLDAKSNNGMLGGIGSRVNLAQTLRLEGDFNDHFTLRYPAGYERDALYVLTPDLMGLLIDEAGAFDLEIVDDWLFVYSMTPFDSTDASVYERLFRIIDTVGNRAISRSTGYRDERVGNLAANSIAAAGRRLRHGVTVRALVIFAIIVAVIFIAGSLSSGTQ